MPRVPQSSDFPSSLTVSIIPPASQASSSTNILLILHGLGDTINPYNSFASALHLPETTCITLQAPTQLPFLLTGYHWGDDLVFEGDTIDPDPGFTRASRLIVHELIVNVLIEKLGYKAREILILGYAQGAAVGLAAAMELNRLEKAEYRELGGVVALGGVVPLSAVKEDGRRGKSGTPVLLVGGRGPESAVTDGGTGRTKGEFDFVELVRWQRRGDGMPGNREEMLPVMQFLSRRLRSRSGVLEGSVELT
ncbi:phospholipase/Carboxylesterase superfamily protein [Coccidioides immitis RS]|uniref:Phospholipase/Carboxylesterase superfamily protein n=2 Tax=Coccidioides immitis TaxID=5501 RepID=J3K8M9_COCIM|nr:phospholipase/Carboxylesterase superfamily protein [Coccidioides immitis RS]EAS31190.3 phospholipase/Carboxylesterase superfamily protein [Coccidioides immitis RS]KMU74780.1 phospholipase/Carboxylesterase superfamily protein [Coccidioides immitis RMSCC 3703]